MFVIQASLDNTVIANLKAYPWEQKLCRLVNNEFIVLKTVT